MKKREKKALNSFIDKYGILYEEDKLEFIKKNFDNPEVNCVDVISQIRSYYKLDKYDRYEAYFNELLQNYDLNSNLLEVASGDFPVLSHYIDMYQSKSGIITSIDPNIIDTSIGSINIKKEKFNSQTYQDDYDLIFGIFPCEATKEIVLSANENKKPFMIALCGCTHFKNVNSYFSVTYKMWTDYIYGLAKDTKKDNGIIEVSYLDDKYNIPYPIIKKKFK